MKLVVKLLNLKEKDQVPKVNWKVKQNLYLSIYHHKYDINTCYIYYIIHHIYYAYIQILK